MSTEARNPRSIGIDKMSAREIIRLMTEEEQVVMRAIKSAEAQLAIAAEQMAEAYNRGGRIIYVGAGTSGRIAAMDAAEMPPTFGIDHERFIALQAGGYEAATRAMENAEDDEHAAISQLNHINLNRKDIVFGITASGKTPFAIAAVKHANQKGVWTCGIANYRQAPLLSIADLPILLETGPEVLTGSTRLKAATAQKLALNRISTAAMVLCGKVIENLMVDLMPTNKKLQERCVRIVRELTHLTQVEAAEELASAGWNVREVLENHRTARVR